jgi:hypothetical protein
MRNGEYNLCIAPDDYPGRRYRGRYAYEHHVQWWKHTGQLVPEDCVIHHKNEDKRDNRVENLELTTRAEHTSSHRPVAEQVTLTCSWCGVAFADRASNVRCKVRAGQTVFFCGRSHQVRHQQKLIRESKTTIQQNL